MIAQFKVDLDASSPHEPARTRRCSTKFRFLISTLSILILHFNPSSFLENGPEVSNIFWNC